MGNSFETWLTNFADRVDKQLLQRDSLGRIQMFYDVEKVFERYIEAVKKGDLKQAAEVDPQVDYPYMSVTV